MKSETRVILSEPLRYSGRDGEFHMANFVVLKAPGSRAYKPAIMVKQAVLRAIATERRKAPAEVTVQIAPKADEDQPSGADWVAMLASTEADLPALFEMVRDLLVRHGLALVDGEVPMTSALIDDLSLPDFENLVGEYLAAFPLAS